MLSGIVLAAGEGRRMRGACKPLLTVAGRTFLELIIESMLAAPVGELVVVLGARRDEVRPVADRFAGRGVRVAINDAWGDGQLSSLRAGLRALATGSAGAMLTLVDHPAVRPETYARLAAAWRTDPGRVAMVSYRGRSGHPVVIPAALYRPLLEDELPDGARGLLKRDRAAVNWVAVDDPGVVADIDTPEDYRQLAGAAPAGGD